MNGVKVYTVILACVAVVCFALSAIFGLGGYGAEAVADGFPVTVIVDGGEEIEYNSLAEAIKSANSATTNGIIKLYADFSAENADFPLVFSGKSVTLDLNGHTLDRGLTEGKEDGYVIGVDGESAVVTLTDTSEAKSGKVCGGNNVNYGGGVYVSRGTFVLENGSIYGNTSLQGGGIYVGAGATADIRGGSIENNKAQGLVGYGDKYYEGQGGAIYALGAISMSGGVVCDNTAELFGGIYVFAASSDTSNGAFTLSGGILKNNAMTYNGDFVASSIYYSSDQDSHIAIDDTNRNASVWLCGTMNIYGSPTFTSDGADVVLQSLHQTVAAGRQPKITDNGYSGESLAVTFAYRDEDGNYTKFADIVKVYAGQGVSIDKSKWNFIGLQDGKAHGFDADGNLVIGDGVLVTYDIGEAEGTVKSAYYIENETFVLPGGNGLTKAGYNLTSWTCNGIIYYPGDVITVGSDPMNFCAVWRNADKQYKYTIVNSDDGYTLADGDDIIGIAGMSLEVLLDCLSKDRATSGGYADCEICFDGDGVDLGESAFMFVNGKYTISGSITSASANTVEIESDANVISYADIKNTADYGGAVTLKGGTLTVEGGTIESNGNVVCGGVNNAATLVVNNGTITGSAGSAYGSTAIYGVLNVTINGGVVRATGNSTAISVVTNKVATLAVSGGSVISATRNAIGVMHKDNLILSGAPTLQSGEGYATINKPISEGFVPIKDGGYEGTPVTINIYSNNQKANGYNYDYSGTVMISPNEGVTVDDEKWSLFSDIYSLAANADGALTVTAIKHYNYLIANNIRTTTGGYDKWISYNVRIYDVSPDGEQRCVSVNYHDEDDGIRLYNYSYTETTGTKKTYYDGENILACGIEEDRLLSDGTRADCTVTFDLLNEGDYRGLCNYYIIAAYGNYTLKATPLRYTVGKIIAVREETTDYALITLTGQANVVIDGCSAEYSHYNTTGTVVIENKGTGTLTMQNGAKVDGSRAIRNNGGGSVIIDGAEILARYGTAIQNTGNGNIVIKNDASVISYDENDSFIIVGDGANISVSGSVIGNSAYRTKGIELTSGTLSMTESTLYASTYGIYGGGAISLKDAKIIMSSGTAIQVDGLDINIEGGSVAAQKAVIGAKDLTLNGVTVTADGTTEAVIEASGAFRAIGNASVTASATSLTFATVELKNVVLTVSSLTVNESLTAENLTTAAAIYVVGGVAVINGSELGSLSVSGASATLSDCTVTTSSQVAIRASGNAQIAIDGGKAQGVTLSDEAVLTVSGQADIGTVTAKTGKITAKNFVGSGKLFLTDGVHGSVAVYGGSVDNWAIVSAGFNLNNQNGNVVLWRPKKFYNYVLTLENLSSYQAYLTVKDVNPDDESDFVLLYTRGVSSDPMSVVEADRIQDDLSYADCRVTVTGNASYLPQLNLSHGKYDVNATLSFTYCTKYAFAVTGEGTEATFGDNCALTAKISNTGTQKAVIYVGSGAKAVIEGGSYASTGKTIRVDGGTLIVNDGVVQGLGTSSSVNYGMAIYGGIGGESHIELNGGTFSANANLLWGNWEKGEYDEFWTIWGNEFQKNPIIGISRGVLIINEGVTVQGGVDQNGKYQEGPGIYVGATSDYRDTRDDEAEKNAAAYVVINGGTINTDLIISNNQSENSKIVGGEILYTVTADNKLTVSGGTIQKIYSAEPCIYFSGSPVVNELKVTPEGYVNAQDIIGGKINITLAVASDSWSDGDLIVKGSDNLDVFTVIASANGAGKKADGNIVASSVIRVAFNLLIEKNRNYGYDFRYESDFFPPGAQATAPEKNAFGDVFALKDDCKWYTNGACTTEFDFGTAITTDMCINNVLYLYSHDWILNSPTVDVSAKEGAFFDTLTVGDDDVKTLSGVYNRSYASLADNLIYNSLTADEKILLNVALKVYKYDADKDEWIASAYSTRYSVADSGKYKAEVTFTVKDDTSVTASGACEFMLKVRPATLTVSDSTPLTQTTTYKGNTVSQNPKLWLKGEITYTENYSTKTESATRKYTYDGIEQDNLNFNFYNAGTYCIDFVISGDNYATLTGTLTYIIEPVRIETVEWYSSYDFSITYGGTDRWSYWESYNMASAYASDGSTRLFNLDIAVEGGEFIHAREYTLVASLPTERKNNYVFSETAVTTHTAKITQYNPSHSHNSTQKTMYSGKAVIPVVNEITGANDEKLEVIVRTSTVKTDTPTEDTYCDVITGSGYVYVTFDANKYPDYKPRTWIYGFSVTPATLTLTVNAMTREAGEQGDVDYSLTGFTETDLTNDELTSRIRNSLIFKIKDSNGTFYDWAELSTLPAGEYTVSCDITKISKEDKARYSVSKTSTTSSLTINESVVENMVLPKAISDLVYDGSSKTCVTGGDGYTLTGHINADAGTYTATATPENAKSTWADGTQGTKTVTYVIAPMPIVIKINGGLRSEKGKELVSLAEAYTLDGTPVSSDDFKVELTTNANAAVADVYDITATWSANNKDNYSVTVEGGSGAYVVYSLDDYRAFTGNESFMSAIDYDLGALTASKVTEANAMVAAYNAMNAENKAQFTAEQTQKIAALSDKLAVINGAKTAAEKALVALEGFGSADIAENGYAVWAQKVNEAQTKVEAYVALSSGLTADDLSGYANISAGNAVLDGYNNALAAANGALEALVDKSAHGLKDGDYTREEVETLLNTAKAKANDFVLSGGATENLTNYAQIARVEQALEDYDSYVSFSDKHIVSALPTPSNASLAELISAQEAYNDYKALSDGAKSLCNAAGSALEELSAKYEAVVTAKAQAEEALLVIEGVTAAKIRDGELKEEGLTDAIAVAKEKIAAYAELSSGLTADDITGYSALAAADKAVKDYGAYKAFVTAHANALGKSPDEMTLSDTASAIGLKTDYDELADDIKQLLGYEDADKINKLYLKAQSLIREDQENNQENNGDSDSSEKQNDSQPEEPLHIGWLVVDVVLGAILIAEIAYLVMRKVRSDKRNKPTSADSADTETDKEVYSLAVPPLLLAETVRASGWVAGVTCFVLLAIAVTLLGIFVIDGLLEDNGKKSPFGGFTSKIKEVIRKLLSAIKQKTDK